MRDLSHRQAEVLERVASGLHDKAIAIELGISVRTVRYHIAAIAAKIPGEAPPRNRLTIFFVTVDPD